ncbi:MAG: proline--tRNA ligase [Acidimicrobiia bacterium]
MRWSQAFIPTLREDPSDAEAPSHRLLVRAGFIRQLMAGSYSLLPLGLRVATKISRIIREEMNRIGGQEFEVPVVHPGEVWKRTGRWEDVEDIIIKFPDRRETDLLLAISHEEVFALLATELSSYRELPQLWYHLQTKFRDEPRPKGGLLRVREFVMKDSYSLDIDPEGLDRQFDNHYGAYRRIFERLGMDTVPVEASSGIMGGTESVEFMVRSSAGEDFIAVCSNGDYAANLERATSGVSQIEDEPWTEPPERFPTPGIRTIAELAEAESFAAPERQIKTMAYFIDGEIALVLLRGDHELVEQKLIDQLGTHDARSADAAEIKGALGADPGSLGAVGVSEFRVLADTALRGRANLVTGANEDDWHLRGVDVDRDIEVDDFLDLRRVSDGDDCPNCDGRLEVSKVIEVGHIFKLGTKYSEALGAYVLDEAGVERVIHMGSYGIGVGRNMAAVVETHHDDRGIAWPVNVAPYEVVVTVLGQEVETATIAEKIYSEFEGRSVEVLLDDRDDRPGVKFNDAELIGIPFRVTVGPRGLSSGVVEVSERSTGEREEIPVAEAVSTVTERVETLRV